MVVVQLKNCRELLNAWDAVRSQIIRGEVDGLAACLRGVKGEQVMFAGEYLADPEAALQASLALSWELTKVERKLP